MANVVNRSLAGSGEAVLGVDAFDTVGGVDVLDKGNLEASSTTLAGSDSRRSEEVFPDLHELISLSRVAPRKITHSEPLLSVLGLDLLTVAHPVTVPAPEGSGVVDANGVNTLDLKTSPLEVVDNESERSASVGTREDVLIHEKTPDEILILPSLAETGHLQEENTVIVKHVTDLRQEGTEVAHTNVLRHLKTGDLFKASGGAGSVTVVHTQDATLRLGDTSLAEAIVTPLGLVTTESDTSDMSTVVNRSVLGKSTPAATKIEDRVARLETNLLADHRKLVVLQLLERLFLVNVADQTGGISHAGTQEPSVEVVTSVVVVTDLLLIWTESVSPFKTL